MKEFLEGIALVVFDVLTAYSGAILGFCTLLLCGFVIVLIVMFIYNSTINYNFTKTLRNLIKEVRLWWYNHFHNRW